MKAMERAPCRSKLVWRNERALTLMQTAAEELGPWEPKCDQFGRRHEGPCTFEGGKTAQQASDDRRTAVLAKADEIRARYSQ